MSITPIEMYTMMPKSQEAANIRHGEMVKEASQQQGLTQQIDKTASDNSQRTVRMNRSENPEFRYDAKDGGNGAYYSDGRGEKKNREEKKSSQEEGQPIKPGSFDVRV